MKENNMKKFFVIAILVLVSLLLIQADSPGADWSATKLKAYADSQKDTITAPTLFGTASRLYLRYVYRDSCVADISIDYNNGASWTNDVYTDSLVATASGRKEIKLRNNTTENVSGFGAYRIRTHFRAAANGVTTATYDLIIQYK